MPNCTSPSTATSLKSVTLFYVLVCACLLNTACNFPGVYKLDIPQGNIIEQEKIDQLEVGMNKRQVRYLLGTPLLRDSFNQDRWDYYFSLEDRKGIFIQQHVTIFFEKGRLSSIERDLFSDQAKETELELEPSNEK